MATEQRKAASTGEHNTVTHEPVAPTPAPEVSDAAKRAPRAKRVTLCVDYPHVEFDLKGAGLPSVTQAGTVYTQDQADQVRTLGMKYGVPLRQVETDENQEG